MSEIKLNSIEEGIQAIANGEIIIVVDDENRENEGDFICAAELVTPEIINFMATRGRGLICASIDNERANELNLNLMVHDNTALHETAFTVSVDLIGEGCTTGISVHDRAKCILALVNPHYKANDFARPGHIFPLRAQKGGVLKRTGHTEAAIDLAKMAGLYPAGVLVEILNKDGTMARLPQLLALAKDLNLKIITIDDLVSYRLEKESLIQRINEEEIQFQGKKITQITYQELGEAQKHIAWIWGEIDPNKAQLVRVQATPYEELPRLLFSDIKTQTAIEMIQEQGHGVLVFIQNTEQNAQHALLAQRNLGIGAQIIKDIGIQQVRLLTNTPKRRIGLNGYGISLIEEVSFG